MQRALEHSISGQSRGFNLLTLVEAFLDPIVIALSLLAILLIHGGAISPHYVILLFVAFSLTFPGNVSLHESLKYAVRKIFFNWLILAIALLGFGYASGYIRYFNSYVILTWLGSMPILLLLTQLVARPALSKFMSGQAYERSAVIVGYNEIGKKLADHFASNPYYGTRIKGFFDDRSEDRLKEIGCPACIDCFDGLAPYVKAHPVDQIYLALPMASQPRILKLLDDLKDTTVSIFFVPDIFVTDLIQGRVDNIEGMPVVAVCESPFTGVNGIIKRMSDLIIATIILVLISPLMLAIALGVRYSSPGPVVFRQRRYGLDGKEIIVYKFRSMRVAEDGAHIQQAQKNDIRVTPFGAFLRKTSLDELPQFINVLQGRMSIVGPRPHAVA
ncbi:MAG TPA: exopolysaccharide biosynthesis polyprenyl glycosylphosphotransferase, partial [Rhodocyclaceae bacterium]|nr:exopolysaccharide biosynthesis polyprenyl glycosylphosphotransferase [Rhodocyclaceae bacterium]